MARADQGALGQGNHGFVLSTAEAAIALYYRTAAPPSPRGVRRLCYGLRQACFICCTTQRFRRWMLHTVGLSVRRKISTIDNTMTNWSWCIFLSNLDHHDDIRTLGNPLFIYLLLPGKTSDVVNFPCKPPAHRTTTVC